MAANTTLEDICVEIGYAATVRFSCWFGGEWIRIPLTITEDHKIARVIGPAPFNRLVRAFAGETIYVPRDDARDVVTRKRAVYGLLKANKSIRETALSVALSERQVHNIRRELEQDGLIPMVLRGRNAN